MTETTQAPPAPEARPEGSAVKRIVVGRPMATGELDETLLSKFLALPIFASDPLSSVAYATEAGMVVLVGVSLGALRYVLPISVGIALLLGIVALSYRQTVRAYQTSGGAYVVAKENLGTLPSLVAGAALLTDYVLTVAVSIAAGIVAIASAAPSLYPYRVELSLGCVVLLTVANLRGVRESGALFALPTYGFVLSMFALLAVGGVRCTVGSCPTAHVPHALPAGTGALTLFVLLKAFASGSAALTGTEAISNGVSAFRRPQSKNAAQTLTLMAGIAITLFLGVSWLAVQMHARPSATVSVLSQLARATFPPSSHASAMFYVLQASTLAVLIFAANTSYQGFPRLAALLARDRFFPRQFVNLGDRLVYSNGIVVLSGLAAGLLVAFRANVDSLIHLYVVGVFTAFTLSQAGMVRYWRRTRDPGWRRSAAVNAAGALTTGLVTLIVIQTKFLEGAWAVIVAIPLLVFAFTRIRRHYRRVARRLQAGTAAAAAAPAATNQVVLLVESLDAAAREALWLARRIAPDGFRALHVPRRGSDSGIRARFRTLTDIDPDLEVLRVEDSPTDAVLDALWAIPQGGSHFVTLLVPEQFRRPSLVAAALRRPEFPLKLRLLDVPSVVVADAPVVGDGGPPPTRAVCRVLASGAHAATIRAARYARTLGLEDTRAIFFAEDAGEAERMRAAWQAAPMGAALEIEEAPYRDLGDPLLRYLRRLTADPEVLVVVVMPELVLHGLQRLLHNQRALYVKRLLLFEPKVVLASVPYRLR